MEEVVLTGEGAYVVDDTEPEKGEPKHYGMAIAPGKFIIRFQPEPEEPKVDFSKFV